MSLLANSHWITTVYGQSGYAEVTRNIFQKMISHNETFVFENYDWDKGHMHPTTDYPVKEFVKYERPIHSYMNTDKDVIIHHRSINQKDVRPVANRILSEKKNVIITTYEMEGLPYYWGEGINTNFKTCITPSKWSHDILKERVDIPIHIVPWGIDPKMYFKEPPKTTDKKPFFSFMSVFQWTARKTPYMLLNSYMQEFSSEDNVALILKTHLHGKPNDMVQIGMTIKKWWRKIYKTTGRTDMPKVVIITNTVDNHAMRHIYNQCDAYVTPTMGEGFCLPILESMACGLPVIAPTWGGQKEYYYDFSDDLGLQGYKKSPTDEGFNGTPYDSSYGTQMRVPYVSEIRHRMRKLFEMTDEERAKISQKNIDISKQFTWDKTYQKLKEIQI